MTTSNMANFSITTQIPAQDVPALTAAAKQLGYPTLHAFCQAELEKALRALQCPPGWKPRFGVGIASTQTPAAPFDDMEEGELLDLTGGA